VARRIDADPTVTVLDRLAGERRHSPGFIRTDNGLKLTAYAIRDWCRTMAPAPPTSSRARPGRTLRILRRPVRDEVLAVEAFASLIEAKVVVEDWREEPEKIGSHRPMRPPSVRARVSGSHGERSQTQTEVDDGETAT
jgi:hypothetical protein